MSVLNDLSRPLGIALFGTGLSVGLIVGTVYAAERSGALTLGLFLIGALVSISVSIGWAGWVRRADRAIQRDLADGTEELLRLDPAPVLVPGRVVRRRRARRELAATASYLSGRPERGEIVVVLALTSPTPTRVVVLAVGSANGLRPGTPVLVRPHPDRPDVALLDPAPDPALVGSAMTDPRWGNAVLPTDRTVVGSWWRLTGWGILGTVVGVLVDLLAVATAGAAGIA